MNIISMTETHSTSPQPSSSQSGSHPGSPSMTLLSTSGSASTSTSATTLKPRQHNGHIVHSAPPSGIHTPTPAGPSSSPSLPLSSSVSTKTHTYAHGVRAHLAELLPLARHTQFAVNLTIHQLWNVPLVAGEFSVKWKFKGLHRVRGGPASANTNTNNHVANGGGRLFGGTGEVGERGSEKAVDPEHDAVMPSGASMLSIPSMSEESSSPSTSPRATSVDLPSSVHDGNSNGTGTGNSNGNGNGSASEFVQEARGRTPYVALKDHHVKWGKSVTAAVQMGVQRETMELQSCELKLVVEQLSVPGDPNAPPNPRLGVVYLNLAEYVDKGAITRRYLLRQSKTNATLQLTLELRYLGGEPSYKAPPLQKGEVMAGVATLLEKSKSAGRPVYDRALSARPEIKGHRRATDNGSRAGSRSITPLPELGLGGLRTTDNIIEAIFNPVPTSSPAPSPFTYYVPPKSRAAPPPPPIAIAIAVDGAPANQGMKSATSGDADVSASVEEGRPPSLAPSARSAASHSSGGGAAETQRKWWQKLAGAGSSRAPSTYSHSSSSVPPPASSLGEGEYADADADGDDVLLTSDRHSGAAPNIVVRSPTTKSKAPSSLSSGSWSHRS